MFRRMRREWKTVVAMVRMYCRHHHGGRPPCSACAELLAYARRKLDHCPFAADKPVCSNCAIHCYRREERERIRAVMRWAGPRMIWRHPILALLHLVDKHRHDVEATGERC